MHPYDLEIGPIENTFNDLFGSISKYFNANEVEPKGPIIETELSNYSQKNLRDTLKNAVRHYGMHELPYSQRILINENSIIKGIHRSDDITTYDEMMNDGSHRTFNFYHDVGPENMKVSYYWLDMKKNGEQTQAILTNDDRWYLRITTNLNTSYYLRMERYNPRQ